MGRLIGISVGVIIVVMLDMYVYRALRVAISELSSNYQKWIIWAYWGFSALIILSIYYYNFGPSLIFGKISKSYLLVGVFISVVSKLFGSLFIFTDDILMAGKWLVNLVRPQDDFNPERSEFLSKAAIVSVAIPAATMSFGILSGAHDYRVRRRSVSVKDLPSSFDGLRIAQFSDIHSGSFFNKVAVEGGVDMMLAEKPDVFFFTGDLVNNTSDEVREYIDIFKKAKAPLGQYSILGNHDYGDYYNWPSLEAKQKNLEDLKLAHKELGWDLLNNESRELKVNNESIGIVGVENWGTGRFPKYGDLTKAKADVADLPTKILLSHDPSHWDAVIRKEHPDIDLTLSGHTHGFQFGVEIGGFKWSPSQYVYKQWADLYQEGEQHLYVNRGFGYIGYPGRVGILPEITILELKKA